jgi:hypothetical protein
VKPTFAEPLEVLKKWRTSPLKECRERGGTKAPIEEIRVILDVLEPLT